MDQILRKLIAAGTMLAILFVMVVTVSYAWFTFSAAPELQGIQISLGGGTTILIAPDQEQLTEEGIYHYPGKFSYNLNFNQYEQYDYLNAIESLSPVSTADGLHWYLPTYYSANDEEVIKGEAIAGQIKPFEKFALDTRCANANIVDPTASKKGNYIYLDFWAVSPSKDYDLRIAQGDESEGSFVIDLMGASETEDGKYELLESLGSLAASVRIGFLVNHDTIMDNTILYYSSSNEYSPSYTSLRGEYQERGENILYSSNYNFTIYEPNGDFHPNGTNGIYLATNPLAWDGGDIVLADIRDRLTVQLTNYWSEGVNSSYYIQDAFQTAVTAQSYSSSSDAEEDFYRNYLKGQVSSYVDKGAFIADTSALYDAMIDGTVSQEDMMDVGLSGATTDICVAHLQKGIPQRVRMFVWIEGQDADCDHLEERSMFALGIELAGSQINTNEKSKQDDQ